MAEAINCNRKIHYTFTSRINERYRDIASTFSNNNFSLGGTLFL
jgi:hypothetical protein